MSAQDLEQRARGFLADEYEFAGMYETADGLRGGLETNEAGKLAIHAIVAALRQQPAPVDLEQFREAVECWGSHRRSGRGDPRVAAEAKRLLSIIDNAGKVECAEPAVEIIGWRNDTSPRLRFFTKIHNLPAGTRLYTAPHQPAPVVDDARMARALEWVRDATEGDAGCAENLPAIEEAIAAYDPNCGARTVRVVDDAMVERLARAWCDQTDTGFDALPEAGRQLCLHHMRAALTAALARAQGVKS